MALVPVFLVALFVGDGHETFWRIMAFTVFAVAVITDRFDGALARSYGMVTEFGKLADPDRRQGAHRRGADRAVDARRPAVVGDGGDPGP